MADHDNTILLEQGVEHGFAKEHAIGHVFDFGLGTRKIFEPNRVSNLFNREYQLPWFSSCYLSGWPQRTI